MIHVGVFRSEAESARLLRGKRDGDYATVVSSITEDEGSENSKVNGVVLCKRNGEVVREEIKDVRYADFLSGESSDEQKILASETVRAFHQLEPYAARGYVFKPLKAGMCGEFEVDPEHFLFSGSKKGTGPNMYFDLVAFSGPDVATYSNKTKVPWLVHSGDQNASVVGADGTKHLFMHSLSLRFAAGTRGRSGPFYAHVGAVGYQRMPLRTFDEQRLFPYIAIADKSTRTLWVVPFSLSRAAIGDSTLISPVHIQILRGAEGEGTKIRFIVPSVPYHQGDFDTGMYTPEVRRLVDTESASFSDRFARMRPVESVESAGATGATGFNGVNGVIESIESTGEDSVDDPDLSVLPDLYGDVLRTARVIVLQDGLGPALPEGRNETEESNETEGPESLWDGTTCLCRFGRTLVVSVPRGPTGAGPVAPSVYYAPVFADGAACGAEQSLMLCTESPSELTMAQWDTTMRTKPAVVYVREKGGVLESDVGASARLVNGIMVIVGEGPSCGQEERIKIMREISVPATRLMGPQSVVLYYTGGEYYFYRGAVKLWQQCVRWTNGPTAGPSAPSFGDRVEFSARSVCLTGLSGLSGLSGLTGLSELFEYTVAKADKRVVFGAELVEPERVLSAVRGITSHEELEAMRTDLALALVQLGVALDAAEMRDLKQAMLAICHSYVDALVEPILQKRKSLVASLVAGHCVDRAELARLKFAEREARRGVQAIATEIEDACSVRDSSSKRGADLQTTQRAALIATRVAKAGSLSHEEFAELIERVPMYAIAELTDGFPELLRAARTDESMERWLAGPTAPVGPTAPHAPLRLDARCNMLEGDTVALALGCTQTVAHFLAGPGSTAFAIGTRSCLPLPVTNAALDWLGGSLDWMTATNDEEQQLLRIKLRHQLSVVRGYELDAASPQLTIAIVSMVLSLAKDIASSCTGPLVSVSDGPQSAASRDDTRQQILRGMVYLALCTAASGKSPALWNFQLTQPHADLKIPQSPGMWNLYADTLDVLLALAGPQSNHPNHDEVRHAACRLIALVLRKVCADPVTEPMRKQLTSARLNTLADSFRERDERVQWARACMLFFRACDSLTNPVPVPHTADDPVPDEPTFFELPSIGQLGKSAQYFKIAESLLGSAPRGRMLEYTRALRKVASDETYDKAKIRHVGARYFVRFSGAFAAAKQSAIALAAQGNPLATEALQARRALVARFLGVAVGSVVPSNFAAFVSCDEAKMRGDEEIATHNARRPCDWYGRPTRGYTPLDVPAASTWRALLRAAGVDGAVLNEDGPNGANGANGAGGPTNGASESAVATKALEKVGSALTLADVLSVSDGSKCAVAPGACSALARMFATLGLEVEDAREVVRLCVRSWRDVNAADDAALVYLRGKSATRGP